MRTYASERERGGCLTLWLLVNGVLAVVSLVGFLGLSGRVDGGFNIVIVIGFVIVAAMLAFIIGTWNWKRWGVYGLVISTILSNGVQILVGVRPGQNIVQLVVQLAILYFLINSKWDQFD